MAGRPRTPTNILKLRGADKKNPARLKARENEPVNNNPVGNPPAWLNAAEKKAWKALVSECIDGVIGEADRSHVAMTSRLMVKMMEDTATGQELNLLNRCLGQLGMTPTERTKLSIPKEKAKNRFDD